LVTKDSPSMEDEPRILELLTQLEHFTPPHLRDSVPGMLVFRRALALRNMGKLGLALLEMEEARRVHPGDPRLPWSISTCSGLRTCLLRSWKRKRSPSCPVCLPWFCRRVSTSWRPRLSRCPRTSSTRSPSACSRYAVASIRLRILSKQERRSWPCLTSTEESYTSERAESLRLRQAFERAQQLYPVGPMLDQLARLQTYDHHARESPGAYARSWDGEFP